MAGIQCRVGKSAQPGEYCTGGSYDRCDCDADRKKTFYKGYFQYHCGIWYLIHRYYDDVSAVEPLQQSEAFCNLFVTLGHSPFLGIVAGALVTAVIQSSSASVGNLTESCGSRTGSV